MNHFKSHVTIRGLLSLTMVLVISLAGAARAQDDLAARAKAAWEGRDDPAKTLEAVELYRQLAEKDPSNREARLMQAEAATWAYEQDPEMSKEQVNKIMDPAIKGCHELLKKNEDDPAANYWLMWTMAGRTLANGVFSGFAFKEALVGTIMVAKSEVGFQYGGVYCYWAMVINTMPGILGKFFHFSNEDAIWLYKRAVAVEPRYLRNHFFLGGTYELEGKRELAVKEYRFCVEQADDALPEAAPENRLYKKMALEQLSKL